MPDKRGRDREFIGHLAADPAARPRPATGRGSPMRLYTLYATPVEEERLARGRDLMLRGSNGDRYG
jgi:hypothetical protein